MKKYPLGEFEEVVLLTVGALYDEAYGVSIKDKIESELKRRVSVGALQAALQRMQKKGYLRSKTGPGGSKRGGRPKRYYSITAHGKRALEHSKDTREALWNQIPPLAWES